MNTQMVKVLLDLQKSGVQIFLTNEGWHEFVRLISEVSSTVTMDTHNEAV